jgi:hypothetical protein
MKSWLFAKAEQLVHGEVVAMQQLGSLEFTCLVCRHMITPKDWLHVECTNRALAALHGSFLPVMQTLGSSLTCATDGSLLIMIASQC